MKKYLVCIFAVLLTACSDSFIETIPNESAIDSPKVRSEVVPIEEALDNLYSMMDALPSNKTRSVSGSARQIKDIEVCGVNALTRSGGISLPDTMAYIVNFADNEGFAVLGARYSMEPIYAITEGGSLDSKRLNSFLIDTYRAQNNDEVDETDRLIISKDDESKTDIVYSMLADAMVKAPYIAVIDTIIYTYGEWEPQTFVAPLVTVKWDQGSPFNMKMDYVQTAYGENVRLPVGCTVVAATQIMSVTRHPIAAPGEFSSYSWSHMNLVSNYLNLNNYRSYDPNKLQLPEKPEYVEQLADVLHYVGKKCKILVSPDFSVGADSEDVRDALKLFDPVYYQNAELIKFDNNQGLIYEMLNNNKPVYIEGFYTGGGHAWVIDGYVKCLRDCEMKIYYKGLDYYMTQKQREEGYMLHFNLGWMGHYDGYYLASTIEPLERQFKDNTIDFHDSSTSASLNYKDGRNIMIY